MSDRWDHMKLKIFSTEKTPTFKCKTATMVKKKCLSAIYLPDG